MQDINVATLFKQISTDILTELKTAPAHGKICFELILRDNQIQRLLTTREVSRLFEGSGHKIGGHHEI
jgi:hypothetical protein